MELDSFRDRTIKFESIRDSLGVNDSRFSELVRSLEAYSNSNGTLRPPAAVLNAGIDAIGKFLFQPEATMAVVRYFLPIVPELVSRRLSAHVNGDLSLEDYENLCLSASLILQVLPSMLFKFLKLLKSADSPFRRVELNKKGNPESVLSNTAEEDCYRKICQAAYNFLSFSDTHFQGIWDWTPIFDLAACKHLSFGWYAARAVALLLQLPNSSRRAYWRSLGYDEPIFAETPRSLDYDGPDVVNTKHFIYEQNFSAVASHSWVSGEVLPGVAVSPDLCNIGNLLLPRKSDGSGSAGNGN